MGNRSSVAVLHLIPHAGGGVGTVLRAIIKNCGGSFLHKIATLESLNSHTKKWCVENSVEFFENGWEHRLQLFNLLDHCDIVHIHWWNHPLLHALLSSDSLPEMRTILWSHVNGLFVPQIFFRPLIDFPDFFVLATPYSKESALITGSSKKLEGKFRLIQSNAGIPVGAPKKIIKPDRFSTGYIGTVDYSKMHKDFISIWCEAAITDSPLIVCGGPSDDEFRKEVSERGVAHLFDVRGTVNNVSEVLSNLQVFMYPLNPTHYGTGEQVLLEAMAFGAVPVVMNNRCEKFLVRNGESGIIANGNAEFIQALLFLKNHPEVRQKMADMGKAYVSTQFDIQKTVLQWQTLYKEIMGLEKRKRRLELVPIMNLPANSAASLLLNSYGDSIEADKLLSLIQTDGRCTKDDFDNLPPACFAKTRGSPFHYRNSFPDDPVLEKICSLLEKLNL